MQRDPVVMRTGCMLLIRDAIRQMDTVGGSGMADEWDDPSKND